MSERTVDETAENVLAPERTQPLVPDAVLLVFLVVDGLLLGVFGLMFTPLYTNGIPVPMGIVLSVLVLPWLVRQAGDIDARPASAGAPLIAWVVAVGVLGLFGPGGDAMLLANWQSLALAVGGIGAGLWGLRAVTEREYRERAGAAPAGEAQTASNGPRAGRSAAEADGHGRGGG